ncbi:MAG: DUF3147 family protein [Terriglobia bacterium]
MLEQILVRIAAGGAVVSAFAVLSDFLKPKNFSGLFAAAPAVALVSLALAVLTRGNVYASTESRSMMAGAIAFIVYALFVRWLTLGRRWTAVASALVALPVWFGAAVGLWFVWLH